MAVYTLEKLTIRDTFKNWRDKINFMTDRMNSSLCADEDGVMTIGLDECNTVKFVVKVPSYFESIVHFKETENEGSYISSISANNIADTVNAGLNLTATEGYVPWISGKTASGHITQYTSNDDNNLYFSFIGDNGETKQLFYWNDEQNRIEGNISHSINSDYADKIKTQQSNSNKNYNISFGSSENGYSSQYEDSDLTYNPNTNTLKAGTFEGYLNGIAKTAEKADKADKLTTARTISLGNHLSGSASFDGTQNITINATIPNTGVTSGNYGQSSSGNLNYGASFSIPYYSVNERGQLTQSKNITLTMPPSPTDELMIQNHSAANNSFPILAVTTANASANLGAKTALFNTNIKINPSSGTLIATNANIAETLNAKTINATTVNATTMNINGNKVASDDNVVHKTGNEEISGTKTFKASTAWNNSSDTHKIGFTVNNTSSNGGIYDWTNSKWVLYATPDGTNVFNGSANTLTTARQLKVNLGTTANATFDGSANQTNIPVSGTLPVTNGGTGATTVDNIKAGKDASGNTISATYATKAENNLKANINSPVFTGTPQAPTITNLNDSSDNIATTKFVNTAIDNKVSNAISATGAMKYMGTIGTNGTVTALPNNHTQGWTYIVSSANTYAGAYCEVGDMIVCNTTGTANNDTHWNIIQKNIDGAVTGPSSVTAGHIAVFNGSTGKVIKDSGFTIGTSVPANAKFTDTTYAAGTTANLKTGTETTAKVWSAKAIADYVQTAASTTAKGVVKIGSNINVSSGTISVATATTNALGLVKVPTANGLKVASGEISVSLAATNTFGTVKVGSNISVSGGTISLSKANVTTALGYTPPTTNTTYTAFKGSGSTAAAGLVPKPSTTAGTTKYLCENGTWKVPPDTDTTYGNATTSAKGVVQIGNNITVSSGKISITKANVTSALGYTPAESSLKMVTFNKTADSFTVKLTNATSGTVFYGHILGVNDTFSRTDKITFSISGGELTYAPEYSALLQSASAYGEGLNPYISGMILGTCNSATVTITINADGFTRCSGAIFYK